MLHVKYIIYYDYILYSTRTYSSRLRIFPNALFSQINFCRYLLENLVDTFLNFCKIMVNRYLMTIKIPMGKNPIKKKKKNPFILLGG